MQAVDRFELRISPADRLRLRALALERQESEAAVVRGLIRQAPAILTDNMRNLRSPLVAELHDEPPLDAA